MKDLGLTSNEENREGKEMLSYLKPPRYEQIAFDIAKKIARNEYAEGEKLYGRSTLAGQYNTSPETVRRAVAILQSMNVVIVKQGKGIIVGSKDAAAAFVREFEFRYTIENMREELMRLMEERNRIDSKIAETLSRLVSYTTKMFGRLEKIEEIEVKPGSCLVGKSLSSAEFRTKTGATVLGIVRDGKEIFSPDAAMLIQEGDLLVFVGSSESKSSIEKLVQGEEDKK
ncbi:TrkA C-terminal domain-containing protein [Thermosyntropha sp.]|uniref:TrkA C-terminal domain-containing protein n=1 Tax=Thermosyntropha sp. TaxID=2740820 RepID=UPI0025EF5389|nr:TrkA C-terminal domain-containing protein [Thermosyntropha sp.]MBO8158201.1 GntR family transcriptional regulator [Thermosyntropha sp.]